MFDFWCLGFRVLGSQSYTSKHQRAQALENLRGSQAHIYRGKAGPSVHVPAVGSVREQASEASNRMVDEAMQECSVLREGIVHMWSDCGPHFSSSENLHHHMYDLRMKRKQVISCSFLAEQHGKNVLDAAFGAVSKWLDEQALLQALNLIQLPLYACMYVGMSVGIGMYVCMYVYMYVCMYVCRYVCTYKP